MKMYGGLKLKGHIFLISEPRELVKWAYFNKALRRCLRRLHTRRRESLKSHTAWPVSFFGTSIPGKGIPNMR
jgi:hypothetical protein